MVAHDIIGIGASAGGVTALRELFMALPASLPATVFVVLHRGIHAGPLEVVLGRRAGLPVVQPTDDTAPERGHIYVAPPDHHMVVRQDRIRWDAGAKEHFSRPAVDPLFRSLAAQYGPRVVGVVLTGYGRDGALGLVAITAAGGLTLAQDPDEAERPEMPEHAIQGNHIDRVVSLDALPAMLSAIASGHPW